jgi:hypothetical protein
VNVEEGFGVRLARVPLSGGPAHDIPLQGDFQITYLPLGGNAVRKDGKILIGVQVAETWFLGLAIVDPATGKITRVPLNYKADVFTPGWASDGRILAFGEPTRARIWRFRPMHDILPISVGTDPNLTLKTRRGTGYYKVPSLKGVWYRSMLGHSGWCATLEAWFDPHRVQDNYVPTGFKPYGARTYAMKGHVFGLDPSLEDKKALISFLKTL